MIAPLRQSDRPRIARPDNLAAARRALAAMLFNRPRRPPEPAPRVSDWRAWAFAVGTVAIVVLYVSSRAWWTVAAN